MCVLVCTLRYKLDFFFFLKQPLCWSPALGFICVPGFTQTVSGCVISLCTQHKFPASLVNLRRAANATHAAPAAPLCPPSNTSASRQSCAFYLRRHVRARASVSAHSLRLREREHSQTACKKKKKKKAFELHCRGLQSFQFVCCKSLAQLWGEKGRQTRPHHRGK